MAHAEHVKITFEDEDGDIESMWAIPLGTDRFRLANIPFTAYGLSLEDVFEARVEPGGDGPLTFVRVLTKSGHRTIRIELAAPCDESAAARRTLARLEELGCEIERGTAHLLAVDIPPDVDLESVCAVLEDPVLDCLYEVGDPHEGR